MDEWLSDTRRVIQVCGSGVGIQIKREIVEALEIKKGSLVEIKIRNTGKMLAPYRKPKPEPISP